MLVYGCFVASVAIFCFVITMAKAIDRVTFVIGSGYVLAT